MWRAYQCSITSEHWRAVWNSVIIWDKGWLPLRENKGNQHYSSHCSNQDLEKQKVTEATPKAQIRGISQVFQTHLIVHMEKNGIII